MAEQTLIELFDYKPVKAWTSAKAPQLNAPHPHLLYGLELEIENASGEWILNSGMRAVEDGSLRNNGLEFITPPATYSHIAYLLEAFFNKAKPQKLPDLGPGIPNPASNYSDRTSIHVHTNVQDLTCEQLAAVCLCYEVFERLLFQFIGNDRDKNIFTVPWYETMLTHSVINKIMSAKDDYSPLRRWQKYTALNLLPAFGEERIGTIEWRHMHGNADVPHILTWLRIIGHIYAFALSNGLEDLRDKFMSLNTTSVYDFMLDSVFKEDANALRCDNYISLLEDGVLDVKYALIEEKKPTNVKVDRAAREEDLLQQIQAQLQERVVRPAIRRLGDVNPDARVAAHAANFRVDLDPRPIDRWVLDAPPVENDYVDFLGDNR